MNMRNLYGLVAVLVLCSACGTGSNLAGASPQQDTLQVTSVNWENLIAPTDFAVPHNKLLQ
jgi:hypothetical protein